MEDTKFNPAGAVPPGLRAGGADSGMGAPPREVGAPVPPPPLRGPDLRNVIRPSLPVMRLLQATSSLPLASGALGAIPGSTWRIAALGDSVRSPMPIRVSPGRREFFDFKPSPNGLPDYPVPDNPPRERPLGPGGAPIPDAPGDPRGGHGGTPGPGDAPLGRGLKGPDLPPTIPGGTPVPGASPFGKIPPFPFGPVGGDGEGERFYRALYLLYTYKARFTVDGDYISDDVDISDSLDVYDEVRLPGDPEGPGPHTAAKFNHDKLQSALNAAIAKKTSEAPKGDVFFNDLDDVVMELKPEAAAPAPESGGSGGGKDGGGMDGGGMDGGGMDGGGMDGGGMDGGGMDGGGQEGAKPKSTGPDDPYQPRTKPSGRGQKPNPPPPPIKPRDFAKKAPPKIKIKSRYTWPKKKP